MVKYYLSDQLRSFRGAASEADLNQSVALISVLLLNADERAEFAVADGATALGDHLVRLCNEQAAARSKWKRSTAFGFDVSETGLRQFVRFLLVCIVHASLEASMATQFCSANLPQLLFDEFVQPTGDIFSTQDASSKQDNQECDETNSTATTPVPEVSLRLMALEALRNLCYVDWPRPQLNHAALDELWDMLLPKTSLETVEGGPSGSSKEEQVACDILANLASHAPRGTHATKDRVTNLLQLLLRMNVNIRQTARATGNISSDTNRCTQMAALADLAANLARDTEYSIILICSLEQVKPRTRVMTSSLAYLTQWADDANEDAGLRKSLQSLNHNLAWTDVTTKVCVQKLAASTFLNRFLHVRANQ
ncbi:hypothetical protein H310_14924 [Aphanomyces invadans]|uniref:Ataxin-10 domain-containing protein n=1 Tax=Aphanomyces invadans TaxID=157072 RepID=A0A024T853_9STRA|nr:hypothetical protein H310_14924 [Aphanomyces invadans]ETV90245.1 hypothetical protein H310_14924 [Aphanomyces invadans]|eukprot:XP_008881120.1 hypothetical protein H310_14924 [Aphanomyces invadans]